MYILKNYKRKHILDQHNIPLVAPNRDVPLSTAEAATLLVVSIELATVSTSDK